MDIQLAMQCTVLKPRPMETITRVPFFTNKQACENAISRLKMIAHYSSTMMPHITMCKLNELLHHFRMESNGIFMKTTPTVYPLPPTTDAEDKFRHILTNQPPPMANPDSTAQGESSIKKTFQATPKSASRSKHSTQPALRHCWHSNACCLSDDRCVCLLLCSNEKNVATLSDCVLYKCICLIDKRK